MAEQDTKTMPPLVSPDRDWTLRAACRISTLHSDAWFPTERDCLDANLARAVCSCCRVRTECADEAMSQPDTRGIWAGLDETERRAKLRRERKIARA